MPLERRTAMTSPTPGGSGGSAGGGLLRRRRAVRQAHGDHRHAAQGEAGDATERCRGRRVHDTQRTHPSAQALTTRAPLTRSANPLFTSAYPRIHEALRASAPAGT